MASIGRLIPRETAEKMYRFAHYLEQREQRRELLAQLRLQMRQTSAELVEACDRFEASGGFPMLFGHSDETTLQRLNESSDRWTKEGRHAEHNPNRHRDP